jgi:hypothetical protein
VYLNDSVKKEKPMSSVQILQVLKTQLLLFFDELISILPDEKDFLVMRFFIKDQIPITAVMDYIVRRIVPLEEHVHAKDENFFFDHPILFEDLRENHTKINYFKRLWEHGTDDDNRQTIWNWFEYFINLGKKYQNLNKKE